MYKHLITRSAKTLVRIGRRVLAHLRVDPRLTEAVTILEAVQQPLEEKTSGWETASDAAESAETDRARAYRALSSTLRDFGFTTLGVTGNHHDLDPYLRYFPDGYGYARQLHPREMLDFTRLLLTKLEEEAEQKFVACRDVLVAGMDALTTAEQALENAVHARDDAFGVMQAERRNWARGLARARAAAEAACFFDRGYTRLLFAPAAQARNNGSEEPDDGEAPAAQPESGSEDADDAPKAHPAGSGGAPAPVPTGESAARTDGGSALVNVADS